MRTGATATRRRALRILGAGAAALVAAPWASPAPRAEADAEILIGQSCQLSGPLAPLTRELQEGAAWCFEQVNARGGVHGRQVRVVALDDAYDPQRTADNVRQLIEKQGVFALFNLAGTPTTLAALPVLRERKVPLIAPFTGTDALRSGFDRYVFNVRAGYADEIEKIVQHLAVLGIDRVGVAYMNNSFGKGGLDAVKSAAARRDVVLAATAPLEIDGSGLRVAAQDLARARPPVIILATAGKLTSDFIAAYQSSGASAQFYALSVVSSQQLIQALGDRSKGVAIAQVMPYPWGSGTKLARELSELASRKGVEVGYNHMEGFVSAKVLVEGLQQAGPSPTRESLVRGLEGLRELDLGGYVVRFSERNHNGSNHVELTIVGASKRVLR
ncbi:ABC transporter substrate-binding protein [Variovorax sp. ZS18.2.2]|uniref:ABC transporter substrate-binding protein n=1 Tax=Variovorax sp. ZS18.2.2 TaxID=2971255 RepID=UPI0021518590|nr:ABC transporter substrate-binding protein [Variovorax sp. ZS18.2.2]MCR6477251.1 ABC transporter substrate-binding protein [Variovorax sp. ZS18.2.2]